MKIPLGYFTAINLALFLQACSPSATEKNTLLGHYTYGPEVDVFQPCNQSKAYWVIGQEPLLSSMVAQYSQLITEPYEQVFIIVTGDYLAKATDGFAMDYDGQIRINSLVEMSKSTETDCSR